MGILIQALSVVLRQKEMRCCARHQHMRHRQILFWYLLTSVPTNMAWRQSEHCRVETGMIEQSESWRGVKVCWEQVKKSHIRIMCEYLTSARHLVSSPSRKRSCSNLFPMIPIDAAIRSLSSETSSRLAMAWRYSINRNHRGSLCSGSCENNKTDTCLNKVPAVIRTLTN